MARGKRGFLKWTNEGAFTDSKRYAPCTSIALYGFMGLHQFSDRSRPFCHTPGWLDVIFNASWHRTKNFYVFFSLLFRESIRLLSHCRSNFLFPFVLGDVINVQRVVFKIRISIQVRYCVFLHSNT